MAMYEVVQDANDNNIVGVVESTDGGATWQPYGDAVQLRNRGQTYEYAFKSRYLHDDVNTDLIHFVVYQHQDYRLWYYQFNLLTGTWDVIAEECIAWTSNVPEVIAIAVRDNGNVVVTTGWYETPGNMRPVWNERVASTGSWVYASSSAPEIETGTRAADLEWWYMWETVRGFGNSIVMIAKIWWRSSTSGSFSYTNKKVRWLILRDDGAYSLADIPIEKSPRGNGLEIIRYIDGGNPYVAAMVAQNVTSGTHTHEAWVYYAALDSTSSLTWTMLKPIDRSGMSYDMRAGDRDVSFTSLSYVAGSFFVFFNMGTSPPTVEYTRGNASVWTPMEVLDAPEAYQVRSSIVGNDVVVTMLKYANWDDFMYVVIPGVQQYAEDVTVSALSAIELIDTIAANNHAEIAVASMFTSTDVGDIGTDATEVASSSEVSVTDTATFSGVLDVEVLSAAESTSVQIAVDDVSFAGVTQVTVTDDLGSGPERTVEIGAVAWVSVLATVVRVDLVARWSTKRSAQRDLDVLWNVTGPVGASLDVQWNVPGSVAAQVELLWDIESTAGAVGRSLDLDWDVFTTAGDEVETLWDIVQTFVVSVDLDMHWNTASTVSLDLSWVWDTYITKEVERVLNGAKSPELRLPISRSERLDSARQRALRITRT